MKYNKSDLLEKYQATEFIEKFERLFCLHIYFEKAIYTENFKLNTDIGEAIHLTEIGEKYFKELKPNDVEIPLVKFFLLVQFYFEDLYVDVEKSNIEVIEKFLNDSIKRRNILFPWIYRKDLYEKYFKEFDENKDVLSSEETQKLLDSSFYGVFQIGQYIVGPLGITTCDSKRILMPTKKVPLFHCPDPACRNLHRAQLNDINPPFPSLARNLSKYLPKEEPSEWLGYFVTQINRDFYYDTSQENDIPKFIINCFDDYEIQILFKYLCENNKLRRKFPKTKKYNGNLDEIIKKLDTSEIFQLVISATTDEIVNAIERLIDKNEILIPETEIRKSPFNSASGAFDIFHECNTYGIRSSSKMPDFALLNLKRVISKLYKSEDSRKQLKWLLRHNKGEALNEKIHNLLQEEKPDTVISELIFNSPQNIESLSEFLLGSFEIPTSPEEEKFLKDKILWKLGFTPKNFFYNLQYFWIPYKSFISLIEKSESIAENIEDIRAVSSNLFVALEKLLANSLSLITWTLLNDHFAHTHFVFELGGAQRFMAEKLNGRKYGEEEILFDLSGKNTLFPLTVGFDLLAILCEEILEKRQDYLKNENELPSFAKKDNLLSFPFRYKLFLFDIRESLLNHILSELKNITYTIETSGIIGLRNKLHHNRENLPNKKEILESLKQVQISISNIEKLGFHPISYWRHSTYIDEYQRMKKEYMESNGEKIILEITPEYRGSSAPNSDGLVIIPGILIGETNEFMRFNTTSKSRFKEMWLDYPKKRNINRKIDAEKITPSP